MSRKLENQITVVTGASRGAGRAIAVALGEAGATVYVTGRTVQGARGADDMPGTIDETAAEIARIGGTGVAVRCDHTSDSDVEALFARIQREHGRLDLLVNNAWGGYEDHDGAAFTRPFWEQPLDRRWHAMFEAGVRTHFASSKLAAPLMLPQRRGLIVSTIAWDRGLYLGNLFYDVAKAAIARMIFGMAKELRDHGVAAVAIAPVPPRIESDPLKAIVPHCDRDSRVGDGERSRSRRGTGQRGAAGR